MYNFYAEELYRLIDSQVMVMASDVNSRLQFIIGEIHPEDACLLLAKCGNLCHTKGLSLLFKIAEEYRSLWDQVYVSKLEGYFSEGNLTQYRNRVEAKSLQILLGTNHVTDRGSLSDFYQCDGEAVWAGSMHKCFKRWMERFFEDRNVSIVSPSDYETLGGILDYLRETSGLPMVSRLLSSVPTDLDVATPCELVMELLRRLGDFNLPNMSGYATYRAKSRSFKYYAEAATDFFNYTMFLEETRRKKSLEAIARFENLDPAPDLDVTPFADRAGLVGALKAYIRTGSEYRSDLFRADFVQMLDVILGAKPEKAAKKKDSLRKLSGSPAEVVLTAVWRAFAEFASQEPDSIPTCVKIEGVHYRHDFQGVSGTDEQVKEVCQDYLKRLLGGLDSICENCLEVALPEDGGAVEITSKLLNEDISFRSAKTAEPYFEFRVTVSGEGETVSLRFALQLPDIHPYRLAMLLLDQAHAFLGAATGHCKLPVFHFAYYKELMMARDADEIRRVLLHCISACKNPMEFGNVLMTEAWWQQPQTASLKTCLVQLADSYRQFIDQAREKGLYSVLTLGQTPPVFQAYSNAAEAYTASSLAAKDAHAIAAMLMRSFLVVEKHKVDDIDDWGAARYEASGIVTILHPAMLEMIQSQIQFLFESFSRLASKELVDKNSRPFRDARWRYYVDMAELKMPLTGLTVNSNNRFEVCSGGDELVHRIGEITVEQKLAATRFLTRYDRVDDEEITEAEMFRSSSESRHLFRILKEYYQIHVGASDGMSLAVYRNEDVQPILAAIDQFAKWLPRDERLKDNERPEKYAMRVVFFSESSDTSVVSTWLAQWQDFLDDAEEESAEYASMRFTVAHRIVRRDDDYRQFAETIRRDVDADIFVFYNFIKPDSHGCVFQPADAFEVTKAAIKFPILEQSQCAKTTPDELYKRSQIVSNRQFKLCTDHTEIMARLRDSSCGQNVHHIVLATGDFKPWRNVIDRAHDSAEWVVCIDALIDRALLAIGTDESERKRELIGFGSGVGLHGEKNYTVSTQKYSYETIRRQLLASMGKVYKYGTLQQFESIASCLLQEAKELEGLSMIRSLGPSEYVRDFMAYCLMHRILPVGKEQGYLCDRIFSVDAYSHWFDQASDEDKMHPDLLWLRAKFTEDGRIRLEAKLIECKMANQNEDHVLKAGDQINNGLRVLSEVFRPRGAAALDGYGGFRDEDRPDQRYWYLQLHRMIAGSVRIDDSLAMSKYLSAMEQMTAGDFEIEWGAGIFAFWTDSDSAELKCTEKQIVNLADDEYEVPIYECGCKFVHRLCASDISSPLNWSAPVMMTAALPTDDEMPERELPRDDEPDLDSEVVVHVPGDAMEQEQPSSASAEASRSNTSTMNATVTSVFSSNERGVPERILLGRTKEGREVFWEFGHPKLNNRHFLIFGSSGMGKTYAIQSILCELGRQNQNSLIVDYTEGFLPNQLQSVTNSVLHPFQNVVKQNKLPINPFKKQAQDIGIGLPIEDNDIDVAKRVTSIFDSVYQMGEQQDSVLIDALKFGLEKFKDQMSLDKVLPILATFMNDGVHPKASVQSLSNKLKPFIEESPFRTDSHMGWADLFADEIQRCQVFQMVKIDKSTARILTEFILWDLWAFATSSGSEKTPRIVVLDEVQNLDQRLESPLGKYLTEGRKFGLCVMAATQTLSNLKKDEQARLFQSGHKLFFRPSDPEINQYTDFVAQASGNGDKNHWRAELISLNKGECLSIGPSFNAASGRFSNQVYKIKISSLEERGF